MVGPWTNKRNQKMAKKTVNPGRKYTTAKAVAAAGLIGAAAAIMAPAAFMTSCDNGTTRQTVFPLDYGLTVEDQTGGLLAVMHINIINEALNKMNGISPSDTGTLISRGLKFIVIPGSSVSRNDSTIIIGINNITTADDFIGAINLYLMEMLACNFNTNIRLANGKMLNVAGFAKLDRQLAM
jgi:hypothetical protein